MHEMDVAVSDLFYAFILKWTATTTNEKVELWTVLWDAVQQLTQLRDRIFLPHQLC
ncbi:hypothetical protein HQ585_20165 [candidate division KSB1 bacterium]|nr:hypothetical protein [candidate division KSB1 bacterium]